MQIMRLTGEAPRPSLTLIATAILVLCNVPQNTQTASHRSQRQDNFATSFSDGPSLSIDSASAYNNHLPNSDDYTSGGNYSPHHTQFQNFEPQTNPDEHFSSDQSQDDQLNFGTKTSSDIQHLYFTTAINHLNNDTPLAVDSVAPQLPSVATTTTMMMTKRKKEKEYLTHAVAEEACSFDRGCTRSNRLNSTYLYYCTRHKVDNLLSTELLMSLIHHSTEDCKKILDEFIQLDELINDFDSVFKKLLQRYNCHNGYSVKWNCDDCKRAYKDWLCAIHLPYYMHGEQVKPCISFCERVEQRCPYLHPITKEQYGGQPVFICRDPNIPFVPEITPYIPYSEPSKCYDLCHLSDDLNELINDSLSKYDYKRCPAKDSIALQVKNDSCLQDDEKKDQPKFEAQHVKTLKELRDVMKNYKNQPKVRNFGVHTIDHQQHISLI